MLEDKLNDPDWTKATAGAGYGTGSRGTPLKGDGAGYGTPLKGEPTKRQAAKEEAQQYGVETKGMSTREINSAVKYAKEQTQMVAEEMSKFVNNTSQQFASNKKSEDLNATRTPATPTSRATEERYTRLSTTPPPPRHRPPTTDQLNNSNTQFPPKGWTTLKVAICKDNAEYEATILTTDPFAEE